MCYDNGSNGIPPMSRVFRILGSLHIAVPLLVAIAGVLAWGTLYETRFGTAAVQRFVYQSWWFQCLLGFLAVNLAIAALQRYPWQNKHLPFVLAHVGIILILVGGILGGRFGIDGQLIIPEGEASKTLQLSRNILVIRQQNPGTPQVIPTNFETQAWVREPNLTIPLDLEGRLIHLTVDRYYPDAVVEERIREDGTEENPAVQVRVAHQGQEEATWLLARDPERFGIAWGEVHLLFLEPKTDEQVDQLAGRAGAAAHPRGVISITLPGMEAPRDIPVPAERNADVAVEGTPYRIIFKDYFPDFAITEQGIVSRSRQPNNPAVSFVLSGPEGTDAYLLFALHPDFPALHGVTHTIDAQVAYHHAASGSLPPNCIGLIRTPSGALLAVLTGSGAERSVIEPVEVGRRYTHPSLGYEFEVAASAPRAVVEQQIQNRGDEVKAEALHLVGREGEQTAAAWVMLRQEASLPLGATPILVEYRPASRELPFAVKLLDFRKIDYPGTQMAAGFESDVQLTDPQRGVILMRKISMNNPLKYRGYSVFQSSYVPGAVETTILSVRNDPGTPFVYAGFLIVILGVASMFMVRRPSVAHHES